MSAEVVMVEAEVRWGHVGMSRQPSSPDGSGAPRKGCGQAGPSPQRPSSASSKAGFIVQPGTPGSSEMGRDGEWVHWESGSRTDPAAWAVELPAHPEDPQTNLQ